MSQDIGLSCLSCLSRYLYLSDYLSLCQSPPHQPVQREHLNVTRAWSPAIQLILGLRESYLSSGFMSHPATYQAVPTVVAFPKVTSYEELQRWMRTRPQRLRQTWLRAKHNMSAGVYLEKPPAQCNKSTPPPHITLLLLTRHYYQLHRSLILLTGTPHNLLLPTAPPSDWY